MTLPFHCVVALFYLFSSLGYLLHIIFANRRAEGIALSLFVAGLLLHTGLLGMRSYDHGYPFIAGEADLYYSASWVLAVLVLILRVRYRFSGSGAFFAPLTLLLFIIAMVRHGSYRLAGDALIDPWILIHLLFMSLAFAVFTVSFLVGSIFLMQESRLKSRHPGRALDWFPPLQTMDLIHYKALTIGFLLLSVGILAGAVLSKLTEGRFFTSGPRQVASLLMWFLYAVFLNVRIRAGWRGRRGIVLSLIGFIGVVLLFVGLSHRM